MGILYPWLASLVLFIGAFILLYFFRKQFERQTISASFLWQEVMEELEAQNRFYKWQHHLLFWLQLLALLLLLGAAMRPYWYGEGVAGEELIFIVDTSATLTARGDGQEIFAENKEKMRAIVQKLENQPVTMITTGYTPAVVLRSETDKRAIYEAIDDLKINFQHEHIESALQLASGLSHEKTAIHVFTDGLEEEEIAQWIPSSFVHVHNTGTEVANVSLRSFGAGKTETGTSAVATIVNEMEQPVEVTIAVRTNEEIVYEETISLAGQEERFHTIASLPPADYYFAEIHGADDYDLDNHAVALVHHNSPGIIATGNINPFLIRGLEALGVEVSQLTADVRDHTGDDRILLTDREEDVTNPLQPVFFVATGMDDLVELNATVDQAEDELLHYVNLANVYIAASGGGSFAELDTIAWSGEYPLVQKGLSNGYPVVALLFPVEASDWPLHANFPIFLYNTYEWLRQQTNFLGIFYPGEEKWLPHAAGSELSIFSLTGEHLYSLNLAEESFRAPEEPGLYQALHDDRVTYFTVHLDDRERTFARVPDFRLHEELLEKEQQDLVRKDGLSFWFLAFGLLILILEWEVYRRHA